MGVDNSTSLAGLRLSRSEPKVLVACERSGIVRDCFAAMGCDAWSCDLEDSERGGKHVKSGAIEVANLQCWDAVIAFPPCTFLSAVNARNWFVRRRELREAALLALGLWDCPAWSVAIENPQGWLNTYWRKPTQTIHPYMFGHVALKRTCLWLKNLPPLRPTRVRSSELVRRGAKRTHLALRERNAFERARTWPGVAVAMAQQWAPHI